MRIQWVRADGSVGGVPLGYSAAYEKLMRGELEEIYEIPGDRSSRFLGVRPIDPPIERGPAFYLANLDISSPSLDDVDAESAAGLISDSRYKTRVIPWPDEHDRNAVVISAGRVYGASFA